MAVSGVYGLGRFGEYMAGLECRASRLSCSMPTTTRSCAAEGLS